jgi:hypothetical protein
LLNSLHGNADFGHFLVSAGPRAFLGAITRTRASFSSHTPLPVRARTLLAGPDSGWTGRWPRLGVGMGRQMLNKGHCLKMHQFLVFCKIVVVFLLRTSTLVKKTAHFRPFGLGCPRLRPPPRPRPAPHSLCEPELWGRGRTPGGRPDGPRPRVGMGRQMFNKDKRSKMFH